MRRLLAGLLLLPAAAGCSDPGSAPSTSATPPPGPATTTTAAPAVDALVTIPVGPGGVAYGPDSDGLVNGPALIAADSSGGLHIHDPIGRRILSFAGQAGDEIDLAAAGIPGEITAMAAAGEDLLVVETLQSPLRQTAHRIAADGRVVESRSLPASYHENAGLTGVRWLSGRIVVEYGSGAFYGTWTPEGGAFQTSPALSVDGTPVQSRAPDLVIGDTTIAADLEGRTGGLRYLGTTGGGDHVVVRQEVDTTRQINAVLITVEWYTPDVEFDGSARIPDLDRQAVARPPGLALLPDGRVVALLARAEAVYVIELDRVGHRITGFESAA